MKFPSHPQLDLNGVWQFAVCDENLDIINSSQLNNSGLQVLEAQVPGNLELDLQRNGVVEEPFYGLNILDLRRYEMSHVCYHRRFEADAKPGHSAFLVFEGVDCFAEIYLNGEHIGSCDNMLIRTSSRSASTCRATTSCWFTSALLSRSQEVRLPARTAGRSDPLRELVCAQGRARLWLGHHAARAVGGVVARRFAALQACRAAGRPLPRNTELK
jgi:hypothetical protein